MSTQSGGFGTRRDLLRTTGVAVGGVLGSALLPAGALAATDTKQTPKGAIVLQSDGIEAETSFRLLNRGSCGHHFKVL